jgi:hypothetical protein
LLLGAGLGTWFGYCAGEAYSDIFLPSSTWFSKYF